MIPLKAAIAMGAEDVSSLQSMLRGSVAAGPKVVRIADRQGHPGAVHPGRENQIKDLGFMAFFINDALQGASAPSSSSTSSSA